MLGVAGDAVVFESGIHPNPVGEEALDVIVIQIITDIPVEFAVVGVAGIALLGTPDLSGGLGVPPEGRHSRRTVDGGVDPVLGSPGGVHDPVGVGKEVAQSEFPQYIVMAGFVAAFGEPDPTGFSAEYLPEELHTYRYLGPNYLAQTDEGR